MKDKHNVVLLSADSRYAVRASALRMRRTRERRKEGKLVLPSSLALTERVVPWLVRAKLLEPSFEWRDYEDFTREDRDKISRAVEQHIERMLDIYERLEDGT